MIQDDGTVVVSTEIEAPPAAVFAFVSDPSKMAQWLGAAVAMEPRVGGALRIAFDRFGTVVEGRVVELVPPRRVAFTWGVAEGAQRETLPPGSTRVVIDLEPAGAGTRVTLRHEGLPDEKERRDHEGGWRYYAGQIAQVASREARGPRIEAAVDAWFRAWNETDSARRREALDACFAADGRFEDVHACVAGAAALDAHVGGVLAMFPGLRLERGAAPQVVRDALRFGWIVRAAGGDVLARGENVADLAPDGRMLRVIGFADTE